MPIKWVTREEYEAKYGPMSKCVLHCVPKSSGQEGEPGEKQAPDMEAIDRSLREMGIPEDQLDMPLEPKLDALHGAWGEPIAVLEGDILCPDALHGAWGERLSERELDMLEMQGYD